MKLASTLLAAALLWAAPYCASAMAADSADSSDVAVLKAVPDDALGLVLITHLDQADANVNKIVTTLKLPLPFASVLQIVKLQSGAMEGLDEKGSAALALLPGKTAADPVVPTIFVPVTDFKKFIGQFNPKNASADVTTVTVAGEESVVGHAGNFAIFGPPDHGEIIEKAIASKKGVGAKLTGLDKWIGQHCVSFIATTSGIKTGLHTVRESLKSQMKLMAQAGPRANPQGATFEKIFGAYDGILAAAEEEVTQFAVGVRVTGNGDLYLDTRSVFVEGGSFAKAAKAVEKRSGDALANLFNDQFILVIDGVFPAQWGEALGKFGFSMLQAGSGGPGEGLTEEQAKKLAKSMQDALKGMHEMAITMGVPKPGQSLYSGAMAAIKVDNAREFLATYSKSIGEMNEVIKALGNPLLKPYELEKTEIDGTPTLVLTMDASASLGANPDPAAKKMMEMMIGPGGKVTAYLAAADEKTVVMVYVNKENLKRAIALAKNPQAGLSANPSLQKTAELLPKQAQWIGYLSPQGLMDMVTSVIAMAAPPGALPPIPAFPKTPPVGFAATLTSGGLETTLVVPADTLDGIGTYIQRVQAAFMPGRGPGVPGSP